MPIEIRSIWNPDTILKTVESDNLRGATLRDADLRDADLTGADLTGADLSHANLSGANLRGADLTGADLTGANMRDANMRDADLREATLIYATLSYANLRGADMSHADLTDTRFSWQSHDLIAEVLGRAAGSDLAKRKVAGLILFSRDWCWKNWLTFQDDPLFPWAIEVLAQYVQPDDDAPPILRRDPGGPS